MANLQVEIAGVRMKNPLIAASGTIGYGREYAQLFPLSILGGISTKGTTLEPRMGNPTPRVAETPMGMLNSVGLENPGVDYFLQEDLPYLMQQDTVVIANIAGSTIEDYRGMAQKLDRSGVQMIELNISCPNVREGGAAFGCSTASAAEVTRAVRQATSKPLMVKLTPNVTNIAEIAKSVEAEGADAVSLINTLLGMRIDVQSRRPVLKPNVGGLSGPAVLPVAVRMVYQVAQAVSIPVVGLGGIAKWQDAVQMMLAGAAAFQVGSALFADPYTPQKILNGLETYLSDHGVAEVTELTGAVKPW